MQLLGTVYLETERLVLRKFCINDTNDMFYGWASLDECTKYFPWNPEEEKKSVAERINNWIQNYKHKDYFQWAIELKSSKKLIGAINLHNVDTDNNSAETSYVLNPTYWNKGYMTEVLKKVLEFAFESLELNRVCADYFSGNDASAKVLNKSGMQEEGILKEKYLKNGQYFDSIECAILASEWTNNI